MDDRLDVGVSPGGLGQGDDSHCRPLGREPLVAGLRPDHRLAGRQSLALEELAHDTVGLAKEELFPAWARAQRTVLRAAGLDPPTEYLADVDISAVRWAEQRSVDWVLLTASLSLPHRTTVLVPLRPPRYVDFTIGWNPTRSTEPAVRNFIACCLAADLPPGWTRPHVREVRPARALT